MHRLRIKAEPTPVDGVWKLEGRDDGLDQIADFAINLGKELGVGDYVYFEIFWPWETEAHDTWDAVQVNLMKLGEWEGELPESQEQDEQWWILTLPPYTELTAEQRKALGIEGDYA